MVVPGFFVLRQSWEDTFAIADVYEVSCGCGVFSGVLKAGGCFFDGTATSNCSENLALT